MIKQLKSSQKIYCEVVSTCDCEERTIVLMGLNGHQVERYISHDIVNELNDMDLFYNGALFILLISSYSDESHRCIVTKRRYSKSDKKEHKKFNKILRDLMRYSS